MPESNANNDGGNAPKFECPHVGCIARYDELKKLKRHKLNLHAYCKAHNMDFADEEALLEHKIEHVDHITCHVCGLDYQSRGGLRRHVLTNHPKVQNCVCPGCDRIFNRAAALMLHIEENECEGISWAQFMRIHVKNSLLAGQMDSNKAPTRGDTAAVAVKDEPIKSPRAEDDKANAEPADLLDDEIDEHVPYKPLVPMDLPSDRPARMRRLCRMVWGENPQKRVNEMIEMKGVDPTLNPFSERFHVNAYRTVQHGVTLFTCPHCFKKFDTGDAVKAHMQSPAHNDWCAKCPQCFARFRGAAALVAHMEAASFKCCVKQSEYFNDTLEIATSGFVTYERRGTQHVFKGNEPSLV